MCDRPNAGCLRAAARPPICRIGATTQPTRIRHSWTSCDAGWRGGLFAVDASDCASPGFSILTAAAIPGTDFGELTDIFWPNDPEANTGKVDFAA